MTSGSLLARLPDTVSVILFSDYSTEKDRGRPETGLLDAPQPVQPSSTPPAPLSRSNPTKRKRSQDSVAEPDEPEGVHPSNQPRKRSPPKRSEETLQEGSVAEADKPECVRHSEEP